MLPTVNHIVRTLAVVLLLGASWVPAWAQQTGYDVPLVDDNLDGIPDEQVDSDNQRSPQGNVFSDDLIGEEELTVQDSLRGNLAASAVTPIDARRTGSIEDPADNRRARAAQQVGIIREDGSVTPLANLPADPVQRSYVAADDTPYAALGIRAGSFNLFPVLTQSIGTTSNADFALNGLGSVFSLTDIRVNAVSDWAVHELRAGIGGSYQAFFNDVSEDLPTADANVPLRLDHSNDLTSRFGLNYDYATESANSDNLIAPPPLFVVSRPDVDRLSGFAELEKQAGRFNAALRGTITHVGYGDVQLSDGSVASQNDRTNTLYAVRGRLGYEISPGFQPFIDASLGQRDYERAVDRNGNRRESMLYALRGGVAFDRGEKFFGELALGYANETHEDPTIEDLDGLTIDGSINWSPQRSTLFTATAQTGFSGSTNLDEAGSVTYAAIFDAVHDVRVNLSLNARVLTSLRDYDSGRSDETLQAEIGAEWRFNRSAALIATIGHETMESTDPFSSYDATYGRVGVRLQR